MIDVLPIGPNSFVVTIIDDRSKTRHEVTISDADHQRLCCGLHNKEICVAASFAFLLDHEPKESILSHFDLMMIGRYFPEFERELPRYLALVMPPAN